MKKIIIVLGSIFLTILMLFLFVGKRNNPQFTDISNGVVIPLAHSILEDPIIKQRTPIAQRNEKYTRYLAATVGIQLKHGIGSGTMIYYDPNTREVYIASCGHLWDGVKNYSELQKTPEYCHIIIFYADGKLASPKRYVARILFRQFIWGKDVSLLKFTCDFEPQTFPIAPLNYPIKLETTYHSLGCDHDSEPARYGIEIIGTEHDMIVTQYNSPRPGRSGGGLLTSDGYYIATCIATNDKAGLGRGRGYFTSLDVIHAVFTKNGFGGLLSLSPKRFK